MTKKVTSFHEDVKATRQSKEQFLDTIDQMAHCHRIPAGMVRLAKIKVNHAEAIITGRPMDEVKVLTPESFQSLMHHIAQFGQGTKQVMVLMINEDHSGIMDLVTKKQYKFK
jgi:hypothetical protein